MNPSNSHTVMRNLMKVFISILIKNWLDIYIGLIDYH